MEERLLTTEDVSEYLRVDVVTVRRLINRGDLTAYRIAGEFRFTKEDLESFVKSQRVIIGENGKKDPFEKFTQRARKVMQLAESEARHYHHPAIGTEHLLLGLIMEGEGIAAQTLINAGISKEQVRQELEQLHPAGSETSPEILALTPRGKKVITLAVEEARTLEHRFLGTEHLLLGLLFMKDSDSLAEQILSKLGVTYDKALEEIKRLLATKSK